MRSQFNHLWYRLSRIGLKDHEDIMQFRNVVLMNRMLGLVIIVMAVYIPIEIYFNGVMLLPPVLIMIGLFQLTLVFHYFRKFTLGHYYLYFVTSAFIMVMGLMVGREVHNFVMLIPVVLMSIFLLKTNRERIAILLITSILFIIQDKLFNIIRPQFYVSPEIKSIFSSIFFLMSMVLTFLIGYYFVQINSQYEEIIVDQKDKIEFKNKEITDSINYARRIQNAILPSSHQINELLDDCFVLYKPKDIVAGDFYWVEKNKDMILFAVADCTGHGVPGAMVSVVCNNALNRSSREYGLTDPGKILDKTREIILEEFQKSGEVVTDGMDISLCALDKKNNLLLWAGANNRLLHIRNGKLTEYAADKQPVGNYPFSKEFTTHQISLLHDDMIYLFSDGYYDQFGGAKGKKFKASRLKELLLSISPASIKDQETMISKTFDSWKRDYEQVDDVCVMGVKYHA